MCPLHPLESVNGDISCKIYSQKAVTEKRLRQVATQRESMVDSCFFPLKPNFKEKFYLKPTKWILLRQYQETKQQRCSSKMTNVLLAFASLSLANGCHCLTGCCSFGELSVK